MSTSSWKLGVSILFLSWNMIVCFGSQIEGYFAEGYPTLVTLRDIWHTKTKYSLDFCIAIPFRNSCLSHSVLKNWGLPSLRASNWGLLFWWISKCKIGVWLFFEVHNYRISINNIIIFYQIKSTQRLKLAKMRVTFV